MRITIADGPAMNILEAGAYASFSFVTKPIMLKLLEHLDCTPVGANGMSVDEVARLLIQAVLPALSKEQVDQLVQERGGKAKAGDDFERVITEDNIKDFKDLLAEEEVEAV